MEGCLLGDGEHPVADAPAGSSARSEPATSRRPALRWLGVGVASVAAVAVRSRFPWISWWYLGAVLSACLVPALAWRRPAFAGGRRLALLVAAGAVLACAVPVPWVVAADAQPPGNAWRLDGRLSIEGHTVDPDGTWLWLTVGRPATVGELLWARLRPHAPEPTTMRAGSLRSRARWSEPAAAAVGLMRGGWPIDVVYRLHASYALADGLPEQVVIVAVDGRPVGPSSQPAPDGTTGRSFTTVTGDTFAFTGADVPYAHVEVVSVPTEDVEVAVGGWVVRTPVGRWYRSLSTGSSHGLMVAMVAYTYASGEQIGRGLTVAGTGTIAADGRIGRVKGLAAKALAARDAGADVLLYPAAQEAELDAFDAGSMVLLGVDRIDDAIDGVRALSQRRSPRSR